MTRAAGFMLAAAAMALSAGCGDPVVNVPTPLVVTNTSVNDGGFVKGLRPILAFGFNRAVLLDSLRDIDNFRLDSLDEGRPEAPDLAVRFPDEAGDRESWTTLETQPVTDLAADTRYELTLRAAGDGASGIASEDGAGLERDYPFRFVTCPASDENCVPF